ncbi:MAG: hypothetical protein ACOCRO_04060 [Halanaerobiales bacterium]
MDDNTYRHFALWAKGHYDKTLDEVICKITGSPERYVSKRDKIYWLENSCIYYGIGGYNVLDEFINQSMQLAPVEDVIQRLINTFKTKLMFIKVKDNGEVIYDLGEPDLFEEEKNARF